MSLSKGFIYTTLSAFFWAVGIVIVRYMLSHGENTYTALLYMELLTLPYWTTNAYKYRNDLKKLSLKAKQIVFLMGLISGLGVGVVEMLALTYSPAINFAFLIRTVLFFVFIFAYIILKEPITQKKILLGILLLLGAYFLTTNGQQLTLTRGDLLTLFDAALIALGNTVLGRLSAKYMSPGVGAVGSYFVSIVGIIIISLLNNAIQVPMMPILLIIGAVTFIGVRVFRFEAYQHASAAFITMIFSFTPVFVALMAVPILGESLTPVQYIGGGLIVAAGVLVEKLRI